MAIVPIAKLTPEHCESCVYYDGDSPDPRPCSVDNTEFVNELLLSGADIMCGCYCHVDDLPK